MHKPAGLVSILLGAIVEVANFYPTTRAAVDALKSAGGTGALMADFLLSPIFGLTLIGIGFGWLYLSRKEPAQVPAPAVTQTVNQSVNFNVPTEHVIRLKYSSRQIVAVSNVPGNHNDTINLDNAATLVEVSPSDLNSIHMMLTDSTPLTVERPDANVRYQTSPASEYVFTRWGSGRSHIVTVGARKFRVSLDSVNDRSMTGQEQLVEYVFGISEE